MRQLTVARRPAHHHFLTMNFLAVLAATAAVAIPNPILFVTQVPIPGDFTTVASTFGNHNGQINSAPRGGDLMIRYPDGTLKNLTRTAGFTEVAVREPSVHWSGTKALFSMVSGTPQQYQWNDYYWQLYEVSNLGATETPVIRKIANQPANYNNVSPFYGSDDRILFTSDRPRNGARHLYPQLDEYEEAPTVTGLWSLDPNSGDLRMLNHSPSGVFSPFLDSYGRIVFTRWDHLQRDQQADADAESNTYGTFDYADESENAAKLNQRVEVFPEPRSATANLEGFTINHFFPWEINEDGTAEETLNHVGRHELHSYFDRSINDDGALREFISATSGRMNANNIDNFLQIREDPAHPGRYFGTDAPEFYTHASGQIVRLDAEPSRPADQIQVTYVTPRGNANGHYRDPLPLSDGSLLVVHTTETRNEENEGTRAQPVSRYKFRIKSLGGETLTQGLTASVQYWDPDVRVSWSGELWELTPVEVRARPRPLSRKAQLEEPELRVFREEGVDVDAFKRDLAAKNLALVVSRDVTTRDAADKQQPFNLRVAGTAPTATSTKQYAVANMQFYEGLQVRGVGGTSSPRPGRRVLARAHSSAKIANDGSLAALVPARRAMSWQTTDAAGTPVVRERYWLTFQPGEVRVCGSCHGVNSRDQLGRPAPQHSPEALRAVLKAWKGTQPKTAKRRSVKP
ncbi:MAG TPA: hypothetical protein VKB93_28715 [Thermoanaerobaculia bacterium]|nr:hypothetical protein [Thermoanaerobaculia bacterium]